MKPPRLDFLAAPGRPAPWSWALLAAGLALLAWVVADHQAATAARADAQARMQRQRPAPARVARPDAKTQAREAALREVGARLSLPWNDFLAALQNTRPETIAMQALEAEGGKGGFRLEAETRRHAHMLEYLEDLQKQPALKEVALIRHQTLDVEGEEVLGFSLGGQWRQP